MSNRFGTIMPTSYSILRCNLDITGRIYSIVLEEPTKY